MPRPVLLAGPTASGKSTLALALARRLQGAVINADSRQVYRDWRILTARPSPAEEAAAPHFLYGHVALEADYSVGAWLAEVAEALAACRARGLRPLIVGGTGLYFRALTLGLAPIPPVPRTTRAAAEAALEELGPEELFRRLATRDPETADRLDRSNPARTLRAWEVLEATGTGLAAWHRRTAPPLLPSGAALTLALTPPREALHARVAARLEAMLAEGVLDEVAAVMARAPDPALPGMKTVGACAFMAHLAGEIGLDAALARAGAETRQYAKRQLTWIRNQMSAWPRIECAAPDEALARAVALVENAG